MKKLNKLLDLCDILNSLFVSKHTSTELSKSELNKKFDENINLALDGINQELKKIVKKVGK